MRRKWILALALAPAVLHPQGDQSRAVAGGGVTAAGWQGKVDANEAGRGMKITDAKFVTMGNGFHITSGPAAMYWNPKNTASGDYTVKASFNEADYMNLNDHPHPYGVFIAGSGLDSDKPDALYCEAYGNGTFVFRGFSSTSTARGNVFRPSGSGAAQPSDAVHKAAEKGKPVSQDVAIQVKGDKVSCIINGTEVQSYPKADLVGDGKLKSLDGVYGLRSAHNTDVHVSGFAMTTP